MPRDGVRLLVARPGEVAHHRFPTCRACCARATCSWSTRRPRCRRRSTAHAEDGRPVTCTWRRPSPDGRWVVEPRRAGRRGPRDLRSGPASGSRVPGGAVLRLDAPYPDAAGAAGPALAGAVQPADRRDRVPHGATAGRSLRLPPRRRDARRAPERLRHPPRQRRDGERRAAVHRAAPRRADGARRRRSRRWCSTPACRAPSCTSRRRPSGSGAGATARLVAATRDGGGRVVAVGTTVVRALESAVDD